MTDEAWFVVRNTPNVTGFVGSHGNRSKPTPLFGRRNPSNLDFNGSNS